MPVLLLYALYAVKGEKSRALKAEIALVALDEKPVFRAGEA